MMVTAQLGRTRTEMARGFDRYKTEEKQKVRKADVKEDQVLAKLKDAFERYQYKARWVVGKNPEYKGADVLVKGINYTVRDVERFVIALAEFTEQTEFERRAGFFISALVNNCSDDNFRLPLKYLPNPLHFLGMENTKNIIIEGNVDVSLGIRMDGGSIIVEGDSMDGVGDSMKSGLIIVNGSSSAVDGVGNNMTGGKVVIRGDVHGVVGEKMEGGIIEIFGDVTGRDVDRGPIVGTGAKGGEIYLHGNYISIDRSGKATIYHKGLVIHSEGWVEPE